MLQKEFDKVIARYEDWVEQGSHSHEDKIKYVNEQFNSLNLINKMIALSVNGERIEAQVKVQGNQKTEQPVHKKNVKPITKTNEVVVEEQIIEEDTIPQEEDMPTKKTTSKTSKAKSTTKKTTAIEKETKPITKKSTAEKKTTTTAKKSTTKKKTTKKEPTAAKETSNIKIEVTDSSKVDPEQPKIDPVYDFKSDYIPTAKEIIEAEFESWGVKDLNMAATALVNLEDYAKLNEDGSRPTYRDVLKAISVAHGGKTPASIGGMISRIIKKADFSKSKYIPVLAKYQANGVLTNEVLVLELLDFVV